MGSNEYLAATATRFVEVHAVLTFAVTDAMDTFAALMAALRTGEDAAVPQAYVNNAIVRAAAALFMRQDVAAGFQATKVTDLTVEEYQAKVEAAEDDPRVTIIEPEQAGSIATYV